MNLELAFDLPFSLSAVAVPDTQPLRITVRVVQGQDDTAFRRVEAHVQVWVHAAMLGMASGKLVPPHIEPSPLDPSPRLSVQDGAPAADCVAFVAHGLRFEPAYLSVLLHKLLCLSHHFDKVLGVSVELPCPVARATQIDVVRATHSELPERVQAPFLVDIDLSTGAEGAELEIVFARDLSDAEAAIASCIIDLWAAQAMQGGYVTKDLGPDDFGLLASEEPVVSGSHASFNLDDIAVDERFADALVNAFAAFHAQHAPVSELLIL